VSCFARFAAVGGLGYATNIAVFMLLVGTGAHHIAAAGAAWTIAALQNFGLNRAWTFRDGRAPVVGQGVRFFGVSLVALAANLLVLTALVGGGTPLVLAQVLAVAAALPVNYAGSRRWAFRRGAAPAPAATRVYAPHPAPERLRAVFCVPTYNERRNLRPMVEALREALGPDDLVVVVDDGSPDGTGALADHLADTTGFVHVLHRPAKEGLGRAYLEGFRYALGLGARLVGEIDCDFSHDPHDVPRLIAAAEENGLALGSRYAAGGSAPGLGTARRLVSQGGNVYARAVLGLGVHDLTGGFKCYRRDVLESIDLDSVRSNGYTFQIETTFRAARRAFRPAEVPIEFGERAEGASKMSAPIAVEALWKVPALRLSAALSGTRARAYRTILLWWAGSRILVLATVLVVQALRWPRRSWYPSIADHPFALLTAWDGRWYRMVGERGYLVVPHHQSDTAFFPLVPLMANALHAVGLSFDAAAVLIANLGLALGLVALYELTRTWLGDRMGLRAAVYAAIFPTSYVFSMAYPESAVLAAMALAGAFAAHGRWRAAAVAAAVAGLARPESILLVLPLAVLAARRWRESDERTRARSLAAIAAAPAAIAGLALYHWRTFGDPLAFSTAQREWGRRLSVDGIHRAFVELSHSPGTYNAWLFRDAAFCLVFLLCLWLALRAGVPASWTLAGALIVLLPLWSGSFTSDARFGMVALPVYSGLAFAGRRPWADLAIRLASLALLTAAAATILMRWP